MIQVTVMGPEDLDPSPPIDISPVSSGELYPFLRDRTAGETEDFIRHMVTRGKWILGRYEMFHDGSKIGTVDLMPREE